jgi:predicted kinase
MSGLPGAGKTTLLEAAAAGAAITPISRDVIRAAMFPGSAPHTADESRLAFDAMLLAAEARLRDGGSVALDGCCFARPAQRDRARELARATGARLVGVHLELPVAEAVRRVSGSGEHPARDRDGPLVARVAGYFAAPEPTDLVLDATLPPATLWAALAQYLDAT